MKKDHSFLLIWIVMSLFFLTGHECRGISKSQNLQNRPWYWGWGDLHGPYGISMGPILRNPYLSHVSFFRSWGAIDSVTLSSDPQLDPGTFQQELLIDDLNLLNSTTIFEGDILIKETPEGMQSSAVYSDRLWPDGKIPFIISVAYDQNEKNLILNAMKSIEEKTCIQFIPRVSAYVEDFIFITNSLPSKGCSSHIGRIGGIQVVSLIKRCFNSRRTVKHELMHAIGFYHEQSRTDRDNYVNIYLENILPEEKYNFNKYDSTQVQLLKTPYDIHSIMHYAWNAMALDPTKPTITAKNGDRIPTSDDFTETDILDINRLYGCSPDEFFNSHWYDANYANNVQLKWARGCDFNGNDFHHVESSAEDCGGHCVADSRCTHFTHRDWGVCYLKTAPKSFTYIPMQGAVCGYMTRRDQEVESTTVDNLDGFDWYDDVVLKWARGCDFNGNDFHRVESSAEDCGGHCIANSRCTHFTWGSGHDGQFCYLKTGPKSFKPSPHHGAVCGYITRRESSTEWKEGKNGGFIWKDNCDFVAGNVRDIVVVDSSKEDCGIKCQEHSECSHFTWNGKCILKKAAPSENFAYLNNAICGKLKKSKYYRFCPNARLVESGDTCWSIARNCDISLGTFYRYNQVLGNGDNCNSLEIGKMLCCTSWELTKNP